MHARSGNVGGVISGQSVRRGERDCVLDERPVDSCESAFAAPQQRRDDSCCDLATIFDHPYDVGDLVEREVECAKWLSRVENQRSRGGVISVLGVHSCDPHARVEQQHQRERRSWRISSVASPPRRTGSPSSAWISDRSWPALAANSRSASSRRKPLRLSCLARACISMRSSRSPGSYT